MLKKRLMTDGYLILRDVIPVELIDEVIQFSTDNEDQYQSDDIDVLYQTKGDDSVKDTIKCFNDKFNTTLQMGIGINTPYAKVHSFLLDLMQEELNLRLTPTYHFGRIHLNESKGMIWHTDRAPCEISVTLPFAYSGPPWPMWLEAHNGKQKVELKVGDILIYKGAEVPHHREPYNNEFAMQHYFHFIDVESEIGSFLNYFGWNKQSLFNDNLPDMIEKNCLPKFDKEIINQYKENQ